METSTIFKTYQTLPTTAQKEVNDFIQFLATKYIKNDKSKVKKRSIKNSPLINVFKDHPEKENSVEYVKSLRKKHWK